MTDVRPRFSWRGFMLSNQSRRLRKKSILSKVKEDEDFDHRHTRSIPRIKI
jgi:hypothetical protein